jgi:hypothetical protein
LHSIKPPVYVSKFNYTVFGGKLQKEKPRSWVSSVSIVTSCGLGDREIGVHFKERARDFSLTPRPDAFYPVGTKEFFIRAKVAGA